MFDNLVISDEPFVPNGNVPPDRQQYENDVDKNSPHEPINSTRPRRNRAKSKTRRDQSISKCLDNSDRDKSTSGPLDRDPSTDRLSTRGDPSRRRPRAESKRRRRASGYRTPRSRSQEDLLDAPDVSGRGGDYNNNAVFQDSWHRTGSQQEWLDAGYQEGYHGHSYDYGSEPVILMEPLTPGRSLPCLPCLKPAWFETTFLASVLNL